MFRLKIVTQPAFIQSQQYKHQSNVWNMFKVNKKYTSTSLYFYIIVNFEHISHIVLVFPLLTLNK